MLSLRIVCARRGRGVEKKWRVVLKFRNSIIFALPFRAISSAGSEHLPYKQRVTGSNPVSPTENKATSKGVAFLVAYFLHTIQKEDHPTERHAPGSGGRLRRLKKTGRPVGVAIYATRLTRIDHRNPTNALRSSGPVDTDHDHRDPG